MDWSLQIKNYINKFIDIKTFTIDELKNHDINNIDNIQVLYNIKLQTNWINGKNVFFGNNSYNNTVNKYMFFKNEDLTNIEKIKHIFDLYLKKEIKCSNKINKINFKKYKYFIKCNFDDNNIEYVKINPNFERENMESMLKSCKFKILCVPWIIKTNKYTETTGYTGYKRTTNTETSGYSGTSGITEITSTRTTGTSGITETTSTIGTTGYISTSENIEAKGNISIIGATGTIGTTGYISTSENIGTIGATGYSNTTGTINHTNSSNPTIIIGLKIDSIIIEYNTKLMAYKSIRDIINVVSRNIKKEIKENTEIIIKLENKFNKYKYKNKTKIDKSNNRILDFINYNSHTF